MPTPQEAVARADGLYNEARNRVKAHHAATGEMRPEHVKAMDEAGVAAGKIRAAAAHINTPHEVLAKADKLRSDFPKKLAHTMVAHEGGEYNYSVLSDDQFASWQSTGEWEGMPGPR